MKMQPLEIKCNLLCTRFVAGMSSVKLLLNPLVHLGQI